MEPKAMCYPKLISIDIPNEVLFSIFVKLILYEVLFSIFVKLDWPIFLSPIGRVFRFFEPRVNPKGHAQANTTLDGICVIVLCYEIASIPCHASQEVLPRLLEL
ncbi:hypothetical protein AMTR_s00138p00104820 [Amborella trichopoda]|uniref:Uncharacterized protein n=1 Tax=Amborella trichopoda TaxID=13333 RepID=W1NFB2_AMBTC|nr:hypothetical protein AMTR_s00138p00104820 [Amborella trichopoda]